MNVLEQDRQLAEKLWECGCIYLDRARVEWINNRLDEAERWATEFLRCKNDLNELIKRKKDHDQLVEIARMMEELGIDVEISTARKSLTLPSETS
jgi:glycine/D-amino acid oxidase-like deaminating enzyme